MQVLVSIPMKPFTCFKLHCCHGMSEKRTCRKLMCNPETAGSIRLQFLTIWKSCWQLASCNKDVPVCKNEYGVHGNPQQYAQILLRRWLTSFVSTSSANLITKKVLLALTSQKQTRPRNCWQGKLAFKNRRFALQISLEDLGDISAFELNSWIRIYLLAWGLDMYWRCSSGSSPMPRQSISRAINGASAPLPESRCFHRVFYSIYLIEFSGVLGDSKTR